MTAKEYLRQLWYLDRAIDIKCKELEKIQADIGIRQMPDNQDHIIGSGCPQDYVADTVIRMTDMQEKINRMIKKYVELKDIITDQIEGMENQTYKDILICRYVLMQTWEDVAKTMQYDVRHCTRLHGRALQAFAKQYMS